MKKKLEQMIKDEITKKINIEQLDKKILNEIIYMIYIFDKYNIKIEFKNYDIIKIEREMRKK